MSEQNVTVKNVVFDIGNVLVQWQPVYITDNCFPEEFLPPLILRKIFQSPIWFDLNLGKITEFEAVKLYSQELNISADKLIRVFRKNLLSLMPIKGSVELLNDLHELNIPLYSLTDNSREIVEFLKKKYGFFKKFIDIVVSHELGTAKPDERIYRYLLEKHNLIAAETVFIDDMAQNIDGAKKVGMLAINFKNAEICRKQLKLLGITKLKMKENG